MSLDLKSIRYDSLPGACGNLCCLRYHLDAHPAGRRKDSLEGRFDDLLEGLRDDLLEVVATTVATTV